MRERLIFDATYDEPAAHRAGNDEQRRNFFISGLVRRAREWGVELRLIDPATTCLECGAAIQTVPCAVPGRADLRLDTEPTSLGDIKIMPSGIDAGKGLRLGGPILDRAVAAGLTLFREHDCEVRCDSEAT